MRQIGEVFDWKIDYEGKIQKGRFVGFLYGCESFREILGALEQTQVHFRIEEEKKLLFCYDTEVSRLLK